MITQRAVAKNRHAAGGDFCNPDKLVTLWSSGSRKQRVVADDVHRSGQADRGVDGVAREKLVTARVGKLDVGNDKVVFVAPGTFVPFSNH